MSMDLPRHPLPPLKLQGACPVPSETEARQKLARDLSHENVKKGVQLLRLPLFEVALIGAEAFQGDR